MFVQVAELSAKAVGASNVYVATEDERIAAVVREALVPAHAPGIVGARCDYVREQTREQLLAAYAHAGAGSLLSQPGRWRMVDYSDASVALRRSKRWLLLMSHSAARADRKKGPQKRKMRKWFACS